MPSKKNFSNKIKFVTKRDGTEVYFQQKKIEEALYKALTSTSEGG